jgi:hypothetical protein
VAITDQLIVQAEAIRQSLADAQNRIGLREDLSGQAKLALAARVFLQAKQEMAKLQATAGTDDNTRVNALMGQLFGTEGVPGDPVNAAASLRDARDRASQIDDPTEAGQAPTLAQQSGDELMGRALLQRAWQGVASFGGGAWGEVLSEYANANPKVVGPLNELYDITRPPASVTEMWAFVLPVPAGLPANDAQLQQLADDSRFTALRA